MKHHGDTQGHIVFFPISFSGLTTVFNHYDTVFLKLLDIACTHKCNQNNGDTKDFYSTTP